MSPDPAICAHRSWFLVQRLHTASGSQAAQDSWRDGLPLADRDDLARFALCFTSQETRASHRVDDVINTASRVADGILALLRHRSLQGEQLLFRSRMARTCGVQKLLGHASITMTADIYGHVQPDRHEAAVEGLDRYLTR